MLRAVPDRDRQEIRSARGYLLGSRPAVFHSEVGDDDRGILLSGTLDFCGGNAEEISYGDDRQLDAFYLVKTVGHCLWQGAAGESGRGACGCYDHGSVFMVYFQEEDHGVGVRLPVDGWSWAT